MGVYVKDMEMPENCGTCPFWSGDFNANCDESDEVMMCRYDTRPYDCPLAEAPTQ